MSQKLAYCSTCQEHSVVIEIDPLTPEGQRVIGCPKCGGKGPMGEQAIDLPAERLQETGRRARYLLGQADAMVGQARIRARGSETLTARILEWEADLRAIRDYESYDAANVLEIEEIIEEIARTGLVGKREPVVRLLPDLTDALTEIAAHPVLGEDALRETWNLVQKLLDKCREPVDLNALDTTDGRRTSVDDKRESRIAWILTHDPEGRNPAELEKLTLGELNRLRNSINQKLYRERQKARKQRLMRLGLEVDE